MWDTGLLEHINRDPQALAAELERNITPQEKAAWEKGSIEDRVLEGHKLAQSVAYGDLASGDPAPITSDYERQADPVVELQLQKAGVRLAYLSNEELQGAARFLFQRPYPALRDCLARLGALARVGG